MHLVAPETLLGFSGVVSACADGFLGVRRNDQFLLPGWWLHEAWGAFSPDYLLSVRARVGPAPEAAFALGRSEKHLGERPFYTAVDFATRRDLGALTPTGHVRCPEGSPCWASSR